MVDDIKIAIDAMGSDNGPESIISGASLSKDRYPNIYFLFFGKKEPLEKIIKKYSNLNHSYEIINCDEVILPNDKPSAVIRKRKKTSMGCSIEYLSNNKVKAVVSAGNTGALMGISKIQLNTLDGILRPAIAATIPHKTGEFVLLDLGANTECNAENLTQFAIMGAEFAKVVLGKEQPTIGILNIGTEEEKGKSYIHDASIQIKKSYLSRNFYGYIEGNSIVNGKVDVIVTDGFSGNIALKTAEGVAELCKHYISKVFANTLLGKISYLLIKKQLHTLKEKLDPRTRNGALLLGLNGIVVKSHGSADNLSFASAIDIAYEFIQGEVSKKITDNLKNLKKSDLS